MISTIRKVNEHAETLEQLVEEKRHLDYKINNLYCLLSEDENRKLVSHEQLQLLEMQFRYMCSYSDILSERIKNIRDNLHINEFEQKMKSENELHDLLRDKEKEKSIYEEDRDN